MTRAELRALAAGFCGDPSQTRFSGKYNAALDRAQEQFAMETRAYWKDTNFDVVADDATYALPTDFMWEKEVVFKGLPLTPITKQTLHKYRKVDRWDDDEGTPKYYLIEPEEARKQIRLFPIPQSGDAGTANLTLTYYPKPAAMSSDTSEPFGGQALLVQYHQALAMYAAWLILLNETATPEVLSKRSSLERSWQKKFTQAADLSQETVGEPPRITGERRWA